MPETRLAQGVDEEKILSKTNLKRAISASFSKFAIQSSKEHSSSSKMIYVIRSDKKKAEVQVTFLVTISFTNIWSKFPLGLQICIPTQIYLLHRKVGDTFHTGNNFRKRCGVKSTTTAISLFFWYIYVQSVTYVWCRHDQNVSHFLLVYFDIIMIKKGYIISKKVSLYDQQISFVLVVAFKGSIAIPKMVYPLETRSGLSLSNKAYLVLIHGWARPSFAFQNLVSPHIIHSGI